MTVGQRQGGWGGIGTDPIGRRPEATPVNAPVFSAEVAPESRTGARWSRYQHAGGALADRRGRTALPWSCLTRTIENRNLGSSRLPISPTDLLVLKVRRRMLLPLHGAIQVWSPLWC